MRVLKNYDNPMNNVTIKHLKLALGRGNLFWEGPTEPLLCVEKIPAV